MGGGHGRRHPRHESDGDRDREEGHEEAAEAEEPGPDRKPAVPVLGHWQVRPMEVGDRDAAERPAQLNRRCRCRCCGRRHGLNMNVWVEMIGLSVFECVWDGEVEEETGEGVLLAGTL